MSNFQAILIILGLLAAGAGLAWVGIEGSDLARAGVGGFLAGVVVTLAAGVWIADGD